MFICQLEFLRLPGDIFILPSADPDIPVCSGAACFDLCYLFKCACAHCLCDPRFRCTSSPDCCTTTTASCTITSRSTTSARASTQRPGSSLSSPRSSPSALCPESSVYFRVLYIYNNGCFCFHLSAQWRFSKEDDI